MLLIRRIIMRTDTNISKNGVTTFELLNSATEIVSSYVSNNALNSSELTDLVQKVYDVFNNLTLNKNGMRSRSEPAVPIKKSVCDDYIVCLEDGKKLKMLKRHLKASYNLSPAQYRERWNLALDYPMVAPNYAIQRSELAKNIGLGNHRKKKTLPELAAA